MWLIWVYRGCLVNELLYLSFYIVYPFFFFTLHRWWVWTSAVLQHLNSCWRPLTTIVSTSAHRMAWCCHRFSSESGWFSSVMKSTCPTWTNMVSFSVENIFWLIVFSAMVISFTDSSDRYLLILQLLLDGFGWQCSCGKSILDLGFEAVFFAHVL